MSWQIVSRLNTLSQMWKNESQHLSMDSHFENWNPMIFQVFEIRFANSNLVQIGPSLDY